MIIMNERLTLTPKEYFNQLKQSVKTIDDKLIKNSYLTISKLADKYLKTGQEKSLGKLYFLTKVLDKEKELVKLGVSKYVYRSDVENYIDNVSSDVVKIIDLKNYIREIPDELVEVIDKTKKLFNKFYIIYTDYTGKDERKVEAERREKDPILFGVFTHNRFVSDRFYYLGDWVDEYCDLTFDKFINEYTSKIGQSPVKGVVSAIDKDKLLNVLKQYEPKGGTDDHFIATSSNNIIKKSFFARVKSIFNKSK